MAFVLDDLAYNNFPVVNRLASDLPKTFRWLIKPADRALFSSDYFRDQQFYDNGLLYLRDTIKPGSVFTAANRPSLGFGITHADLVARFLSQVEENCLFQEQANLADSDEGIQLMDPDGSLAPILEHFMCPVCLDPCFPPSYVCPNSHILCGQCRNSLLKVLPDDASPQCPTCRVPTKFEHSFAVNGAIVGTLNFKCRYSVYGCKATPSGATILGHIANDCPYRPWRCYFCPRIVQIAKFGKHLLSEHRSEIPLVMKEPNLPARFMFEVPVAVPNERNRSSNGELVKLGCCGVKNEGFFILLEMQLQYGSYGWAVGFLGPKKNSKKFVADIGIKIEYDVGGSRPTEFVTDLFTDQPVLSFQDEMRTILENVRTAKFTNGFAMKDFSRYGGAGRFHAVMELEIRYVGSDRTLN